MNLFNIFKRKEISNEKILIAYSKYFKSYIRLCKYNSNNSWTFALCNSKGVIKSGVMIATSKYDEFKWNSVKGYVYENKK